MYRLLGILSALVVGLAFQGFLMAVPSSRYFHDSTAVFVVPELRPCPLMDAIDSGDLERVAQALSQGEEGFGCACPPMYHIATTPLERAIRQENVAMVRMLLAAEVTVCGDALKLAVQVDSEEMAEELVDMLIASEQGASVNSFGLFGREAALHLAAELGRVGAVRRLLEAGADPLAYDMDDWTPIHYADQGGFAEVVEILREAARVIEGSQAAERERRWRDMEDEERYAGVATLWGDADVAVDQGNSDAGDAIALEAEAAAVRLEARVRGCG